MIHKGGRKPALYSVEMGQWVHKNWLANTSRAAEPRTDAGPVRASCDARDEPDQPAR
jgi:hypothetical protein